MPEPCRENAAIVFFWGFALCALLFVIGELIGSVFG